MEHIMISIYNCLHKLSQNNQSGIKLDKELAFYFTKRMLIHNIGQAYQRVLPKINISLVIGQGG